MKKDMKRLLGCLLGVTFALYINAQQLQEPVHQQLHERPSGVLYKQASAPIEARVNDLLNRMTVEEK